MPAANKVFIAKLRKLGTEAAAKAKPMHMATPPPSEEGGDAFFEPDAKSGPEKVDALIDEVLWAKGDQWPGFVRPSMIGGCKRASYFHLMQAPSKHQRHEPKMVRVLDTGTLYHRMIQEYLADSLKIYFAPESPVWDEELAVRGKCDGICITRDLSAKWMVEIKTISSSGFKSLSKPMPKHIWQAHTYAALHGCKWIDMLYICKDNQVWKCWRVEFNDAIWKEITDWVDLIRTYGRRGVPPTFNEKECDPSFCGFVDHCFKLKAQEEKAKSGKPAALPLSFKLKKGIR